MSERVPSLPKKEASEVDKLSRVSKGLEAKLALLREGKGVRTDPDGIREVLEKIRPPED